MRRDNKDILIGYIATLSDKECKDIYYALNDIKIPKRELIEFDLVKISQGQYSKLIWMWGKDKTDECISILNEWLGRTVLRNPFVSHYRMLLGWVDNCYRLTHKATDKTLRYNSEIDTAWKAKKYIKSIPEDLRAYDSEVKYLVERFGKNVLT